jgi:DNA repair ATPase RecN
MYFCYNKVMQDLSDDEEKNVLGEVLLDKLKAIEEYVKGIPDMKQELHQVKSTVNEVNDRLSVIESVVKEHESDIRQLKHKTA